MTELSEAQQEREKIYLEAIEHLLLFNAVPTQDLPKMGNWSAGRLIDMVGAIKQIHKDADTTIKFLNGVIDSKATPDELEGKKTIDGEKFKLKFVPMEQNRVKTEYATAAVTRLARLVYQGDPDIETKVQREVQGIYAPVDMTQHRYDRI